MRRVPIGDEPVGAHRPETVAGRLASDLADNLNRLHTLETRMATMDETLADFDTVVAAAAAFKDSVRADVRTEVDAEFADQVGQRVTALKTAMGLAQPDPNQPDPNQPDPNQPV